ncbi:MAG: Hsp20/alpha crystallin family protein [Candidatus Methanoperedens sp.]|nr:Hsp20/alpha crystallin family protein [Candidatus Methanoperedens sp.]
MVNVSRVVGVQRTKSRAGFRYMPAHEVKIMRRTIRPRPGKRPELSTGIGIGEVFKGLGSIIELVSEMAEKGQEKVERTGEIETPAGKAMYGFSVKIGGKGLQVERFGNIVRETEKGAVVEEMREPFVDIFEEAENIEVIAELPGVEEKDITYEIKDDVLLLKASGDSRKYSKEVLLPCKVSLLKSAYKNGVLRLTLEKQTSVK